MHIYKAFESSLRRYLSKNLEHHYSSQDSVTCKGIAQSVARNREQVSPQELSRLGSAHCLPCKQGEDLTDRSSPCQSVFLCTGVKYPLLEHMSGDMCQASIVRDCFHGQVSGIYCH